MSIELLNDCVILPTPPNWAMGVNLRRAWDTKVASGVTGSEDRATSRLAPYLRMEWDVLAGDGDMRRKLASRMMEALRTGRGMSPIWPRQQHIDGAIDMTFCYTSGSWVWSSGDVAFFMRPGGGEQIDKLINCGGPSVDHYAADKLFSGGTTFTTSEVINLSHLDGLPDPPEAVYQSARHYSGEDPTPIVYTIPRLQRGVPCRVRVHVAELETGFDRSTSLRLIDIVVRGESSVTQQIEPYRACGWEMNSATPIDAIMKPDDSGNLVVSIIPAVHQVDEVISRLDAVHDWGVYPSGYRVLYRSVFGVDNGVWEVAPNHTLFRPDWAATSTDLVGLVVMCSAGGVETWWKCSTAGPINIGTTEIDFDAYTGTKYHAMVCAIEIYQHAWDIVTLNSFTSGNLLRWDGWLKGIYDNCFVYPVMFGKPSVEQFDGQTDAVAKVKLTLQEPVGTGVQATPGTCPVEICGWANPLPPFVGDPGVTVPEGASSFSSDCWWVLGSNTPSILDRAQILFSWQVLQKEMIEQNVSGSIIALYWEGPSGAGDVIWMNSKYEAGDNGWRGHTAEFADYHVYTLGSGYRLSVYYVP